MNKQRRKALQKIVDILIEQNDILEAVKDEEQDAMDNVPESLQESEKYEAMEEAVDSMDDAMSNLQDIIESLSEIIGN